MENYFDCLSVNREQFMALMEENNWRCNAAGRTFMAERVQAIRPRQIEWSLKLLQDAEKLGGLVPGMTFDYPNAQGGISTAKVVSLYDIPRDLVNPYLYVFSGHMLAAFYGFEILRFYAKMYNMILPFVSSGKEGNKGLFKKLFYRENGIIRDTEYDAYCRIMAMLLDHDYAYQNYETFEDDDSAGNLVEMYKFARTHGLKEMTLLICSGNPFYDKRLLAEWMYQLKGKQFEDVKINLVLVHCPLYVDLTQHAIPEARISEVFIGYVAASIGPLYKDTIDFDGATNSSHPERYLMPGVKDANWNEFRDIIVNYSNMGWPNYQEILYGIEHKEAVSNIILSDLFARASYEPENYDSGIMYHLGSYKAFLACDGKLPGKDNLLKYLKATTDRKFFSPSPYFEQRCYTD